MSKDIKYLPEIESYGSDSGEYVSRIPVTTINNSESVRLVNSAPCYISEASYDGGTIGFNIYLNELDATKNVITLFRSQGIESGMNGYTVHISSAFVSAMPVGHSIRFVLAAHTYGGEQIGLQFGDGVIVTEGYTGGLIESGSVLTPAGFTLIKDGFSPSSVFIMANA